MPEPIQLCMAQGCKHKAVAYNLCETHLNDNVGRNRVFDRIKTFTCKTKAGNSLQFFYNPDNNLVVVDINHKNGKGGNEICRMTLVEEALLAHCEGRKHGSRKNQAA